MFDPDYEQYGYSPSLYEDLKQAKVELMDGDRDIFGDGSVKVISTPEHTPSHCSLLLRLAKTGPVLLSGDVAHFRFNDDCCLGQLLVLEARKGIRLSRKHYIRKIYTC